MRKFKGLFYSKYSKKMTWWEIEDGVCRKMCEPYVDRFYIVDTGSSDAMDIYGTPMREIDNSKQNLNTYRSVGTRMAEA